MSNYATSSPDPFKVEHVIYVEEMDLAEQLLELKLQDYRLEENREWYCLPTNDFIRETLDDIKNYLEFKRK